MEQSTIVWNEDSDRYLTYLAFDPLGKENDSDFHQVAANIDDEDWKKIRVTLKREYHVRDLSMAECFNRLNWIQDRFENIMFEGLLEFIQEQADLRANIDIYADSDE